MWPDRISILGHLALKSDALPTVLRGLAVSSMLHIVMFTCLWSLAIFSSEYLPLLLSVFINLNLFYILFCFVCLVISNRKRINIYVAASFNRMFQLDDLLYWNELFVQLNVCVFREHLSAFVFATFPFGCEAGIWDFIV